MFIFNKIILLVILSLVFLSCASEVSKEKSKPNIILIMADDMGYSDLGCFGGEIETPHLDQLGYRGVRFTQFYNTARCCPSRASLMTGLYAHAAGIGRMSHRNRGDEGYIGYLNENCVTMAEVLQKSGYQTNMVGKWHSGAIKKSWPENRGFQRFYGMHHYVDSYFKVLYNSEVFENGKMVIPEEDNPVREKYPYVEWYTTDVFTDKALEYMDESLKSTNPFFMYVAYNTPHWPLEAHDHVIAKYLDKYQGGWDSLRQTKFKRMIDMGILDKKWKLSDPVEMTEWAGLSDSVKMNLEFRRAIYAAQIDIMDQNVGRLIDHLKVKGVYDNTIIIFLSDNGSSGQPLEQLGGRHFKTNTRWNYRDWRRNSARNGASQGVDWALVSNTPFRKYKKYTHEGGIATPLIVSWPKGLKNPGRMEDTPSHIIDLMPTIIDVAGAEYPSDVNGNRIKPLSGVSLAPVFEDLPIEGRESIFWEHETHAAIRDSQWKLVTLDARDSTTWELYNIEEDRAETNNLIAEYPDVAADLLKKWTAWGEASNVLPWPGNGVPNPVDK